MNVMHQTGNVAWSIFDADYGKYNRMSLENGTGGGMFWDTMSAAIGQEFTDDDVTSIVESDITVGNTVKADSIEELAALIGAPADVLKETIDRYNELVTKGADDDFHKPADFLYPVVKAPFYAAKVGVPAGCRGPAFGSHRPAGPGRREEAHRGSVRHRQHLR